MPVFGALAAGLLAGTSVLAQEVSNRDLVDRTVDANLPRVADGVVAELLSAFHGLEALPIISNLICRGSRGYGGMPVIFATEIDLATLETGDFRVTRASGAESALHCVSVLPATDKGELRTVLLIGDLGDPEADPPVRVEISGHLHSADALRDYQGAAVAVTPLTDGPSIVQAVSVSDWAREGGLGPRRTRGTRCPSDGIVQAVRVTWAGGITYVGEGDAEMELCALYKVTVQDADGMVREVMPAALADLGDNDNNHMLCLDTADAVVSVVFPAGMVADPNGDLNPATQVAVRNGL